MTEPNHPAVPPEGPREEAAAPSDGELAVIPSATTAVDTTNPLPTEALLQLRKLGELREQELKRHELVIAEMREHVRRQTTNGRLILLLALGMLALIAGLALAVHQLRNDQAQATAALTATAQEVNRVGGLVRDTAAQSATQLEGVGAALDSSARKLDAVQLGLHATVNDSMQSLRQEREAIVGGVRLALEDQNRKQMDRELALREREKELQQEAQRVRDEQHRIIQEAIDKLSGLSPAPPAGAPDTP